MEHKRGKVIDFTRYRKPQQEKPIKIRHEPSPIPANVDTGTTPFLERYWRVGENVLVGEGVIFVGLGYAAVQHSLLGSYNVMIPEVFEAGMKFTDAAFKFGVGYAAARSIRALGSGCRSWLIDHHRKTNWL